MTSDATSCRALGSEVEAADSTDVATADELPSPSLVVDLDAFEANVETATRMFDGAGKRLRPHIKTHRTPGLALRQLGGVAPGVTCATVGEAEVMARGGIDDLLIANEIVARDKLDRVASLARQHSLSVVADSLEGVRALAGAAERAGSQVSVLVDVDVGLGRCGVRSPAEAVALAGAIRGAASLRFAGIMGYEGRVRKQVEGRRGFIARAFATLAEARSELVSAGFEVEVVSAAGTSTLREALSDPVITEIQAGTYALMEDDLLGLGLPFTFAARVLCTVISRFGDQTVLDAGRKTIGCDGGLPIPADGTARAVGVSEEHVMIRWDGRPPALGARVALRPSHVRTTFNLHDRVWLLHGEAVVGALPVSARGMSQ